MNHIGAILSSYNRQAQTLECLSILERSAIAASVDMQIVLFDDGSTDGTPESVKKDFPKVQILHGNGNYFWANSMAHAERHLRKISSEIDYVMWINDDVKLDEDAVLRLLKYANKYSGAIIVGAMRDPVTGETTYGGFRQHNRKPLKFFPVQPTANPQPIDTFNGNLVLVPEPAAHRMGGIDGAYAHALADIDYGLRARNLGIQCLLAPGTYGSCARNPPSPWLGMTSELRTFTSIKGGGNPKSLRRILRKQRPLSWPVHFATIYASWVSRTAIRAVGYARNHTHKRKNK